MNLLLIFIVAACLWGVRLNWREFNANSLNQTQTTQWNGLFILIVYAAHLRMYVELDPWLDGAMLWVVQCLGQLMVAGFLFNSGYGVAQSLRRKPGYVRNIPVKRVLVTWVNFAIAVTMFLILDLAIDRKVTVEQVLYSYIGWKSIGSSSWYIFAILVLYGLTWVVYRPLEARLSPGLLLVVMFVAVLAFTGFMYWVKGPGAAYTYNTVLCYPFGMLYSHYQPRFETLFTRSNTWWLGSVVVTATLFGVTAYFDYLNYLVFEVESMLFNVLTVLVMLKLSFGSPLLAWFGRNLFWIYVLQRLPMLFLRDGPWPDFGQVHPYWFMLISTIVTLILTALMSRLVAPLDARLVRLLASKS